MGRKRKLPKCNPVAGEVGRTYRLFGTSALPTLGSPPNKSDVRQRNFDYFEADVSSGPRLFKFDNP